MKPKRARRTRPDAAMSAASQRGQRARQEVVPASERGEVVADAAKSTHAVYDVALLDELRGLWRRGQWNNLASIGEADLEPHPDRARLATLVAAAHQATGNRAGVANFVELARRWGADRGSIARALLSSVHNTLGRASAMAGARPSTVYRHFEQSVSFCGMRPASEAMVQTRLEAQLPAEYARAPGTPGPHAHEDAPHQLKDLVQQLRALRLHIDAGTNALQARVDRLLPAVGDLLRRESATMARQIEAHANLQAYFSGQALMPDLHGWPVSPDLAVHLVRLLGTERFDAVVEFGSGSSTQLMARALRQRPGAAPVAQVAFEHLEPYQAQTQALLREAGLSDAARVVLAPLKPRALRAGQAPYYDCDAALAELAQALDGRAPARLLVLVDGPPASTGPLARMPALEVMRQHFPAAELVLLLDDHRRDDEREVARRWREQLEQDGVAHESLDLDLDKGACQLTVKPQPRTQPTGRQSTGT